MDLNKSRTQMNVLSMDYLSRNSIKYQPKNVDKNNLEKEICLTCPKKKCNYGICKRFEEMKNAIQTSD